jgi:hypothetical protein
MTGRVMSVGWVYYIRLVDTKFQANCLKARFEDAENWLYKGVPKYVGVFQTASGRFGIKALW